MENKTRIEQPKSVSGALDELLDKMYISNVQNRLRQLNEPTENDCKRWVWELIQNAKDSISQDDSRDSVDIKLIVKGKEVKFSHNGAPFSARAQLGLLYKYSEGKTNNSESTGRFGTGFLTTHTLSKIVSIEGDVFTDDSQNTLCGFSATMYRDGLDAPELLEGVKKMRESMVYTQEINNWTTFTYHLRTPQNENALRLGLENFISNIAQTMLFCKELNSVELDNNGDITKIFRKERYLLEKEIYLSEFEINSKEIYIRKFIHKSLKKHSEVLSKRFKTERNIRLTATIEIDENKNLIENQDIPSHFCVLPLVGSEKHIMPIYLNSPDFEPDSERESLILIGDDILADKGVISEGGINRLILKESVALYDSLVSYLSENGYHKLFLLAKGLKKVPKFEKNFNKKWFEEEIIESYREVLKKYAVVETKIGNQKLFEENGNTNIIIPKDSNIENLTKIYDLSTEIFANKLPIKEVANDWAELAWKDCGLFKLEDLCKYISEKENISNLPVSSNQYEWLNSFLLLIKEIEESLLKDFALVPNRNGDFVSLENEEFAEGIGLTDYMIEVLNDLGEDLTPLLLNNNITAINLPLKIDSKSIADKINERADDIVKDKNLSIEETIKGLLPLLNTIPTDASKYDIEFICKQKQIHNFTKMLYGNLNIHEITNNDISEKAYQALQKWMIVQLMETVSKYQKVELLPETIDDKIEWINSFISFVSKEVKVDELDKCAIIPNQKGDFCNKGNLSKDINIPEELKSERAEKFGIKLKDSLLHKEINSINIASEKNINTVVEIINEVFTNKNFEEDYDDLDFAIFLIHFLPEETSPLLQSSQKTLLDIVKKYYYNRSSLYSQAMISCNVEDFWRKANDKIIRLLQTNIEECETIEGLKNFLSESGKTYDDGDTIIFLNDFYNYLKRTGRNISEKIVPNQNGNFCFLDEIYKDDNVPDPLKDILYLIKPEDDFRNILAYISLSIQPTHYKKIEDIAQILDNIINDIFKNKPYIWSEENFRKAIELLMIDWFPTHKEQAKIHFQHIYKKKETIEMNVLWSLEERQRMQRARSIDPKLLDKFIESNGDIETLEKQKNELEAKILELQAQVNDSVSNAVRSEIATEFPDITADRIRELLKLEERIKGWSGQSDYQPANEVEERRNFENGYKGEAYIYSQLKKSGIFKSVTWEHKSETPTDFIIVDYKGNAHFIKDNFSKYDLTAETVEGNKIYIEVKSTRTSIEQADTIALPISSREWKFVNEINGNEKYCLARVFDVESNPEGHFLSLMGIGINQF